MTDSTHKYRVHHRRRTIQYDPKLDKLVDLTFYVKSKAGKCKTIENDRIFIIGIKNHATQNYEEFACNEDEWFLVLEAMLYNDRRQKAVKRYTRRLNQILNQLNQPLPTNVADFL